jgi:hypothetical protein
MELYEFAYLDDSRIKAFMAGADGGLITSSKKILTAKTNKEGNAGVGFGGMVNLGGRAAKADEFTEEVAIEATPESTFYRLKKVLTSNDELISDRIDNIIIGDLETRAIIEIDGMLEVSPAYKVISSLSQYIDAGMKLGLINLNKSKDKQSLWGLQTAFDINHLSIIMNADENQNKLFAVLNRSLLGIPPAELNEDYTILGKIIRIIKASSSIDLLPYCMNPDFRRNKGFIDMIKKSISENTGRVCL